MKTLKAIAFCNMLVLFYSRVRCFLACLAPF